MKRQSVGLRRSKEESRQNQSNETKRLKVHHNQENVPSYSEEKGSGSDTTEECINSNGHDKNLSQFLTPEEPAFQGSSENGIGQDTHLNGSFKNDEINSTSGVSANSLMDNITCNDSESNIQLSIATNGANFNVQENNGTQSVSVISHGNDFLSPVIIDSMESPESSQSTLSSIGSNLESSSKSHQLSSSNEESELAYQAFMNLEDCINKGDSKATVTSEQVPQEPLGDVKSVKVTTYSSNDQEKSLSSECQASGSKLSSSKLNNDIENITLCQLKVTLLEGHADVIYSVASDKDFILSSSGDTTVKVWDVEEKKEIANFAGHNASVTSVILLNAEQSANLGSKLECPQTSRIAVSASYDCHIRLWSVLDGHEIISMYTFNSITCMDILQDQLYAVVGTEGGKLEVWDLHLAKLVNNVYAHDLSVSQLKVDGCYVYSTSKDGAVKVWLFDDGELQPLYARRRKEAIPGSSDFGPTRWQSVAVHNDMLFLGDYTNRLKTLDWRIGRLRLFANQADVNGVCEAVSAKNNILLSTFFDSNTDTGGINVWRLPEMVYVGTLTGDLQEICSLDLTQSNEKLRIVSGGHQLLVWDFDFSQPPQKNAQDPFFVCEADKIGSEINEETIETAGSPNRIHSGTTDNVENKKSWCNLS